MHATSIIARGHDSMTSAPVASAHLVGLVARLATVVAAFLLMALVIGSVVAASVGLGAEGQAGAVPVPVPPPVLAT